MGVGMSIPLLGSCCVVLLGCAPCILICCILICVYGSKAMNKESFNNQTGKFCTTCSDKNINDCQDCFNCGYCQDESGQGKCIGIDREGPMNNERCDKLSRGDDWYKMVEMNNNYKPSYGPKQGNRVIGVDPC